MKEKSSIRRWFVWRICNLLYNLTIIWSKILIHQKHSQLHRIVLLLITASRVYRIYIYYTQQQPINTIHMHSQHFAHKTLIIFDTQCCCVCPKWIEIETDLCGFCMKNQLKLYCTFAACPSWMAARWTVNRDCRPL